MDFCIGYGYVCLCMPVYIEYVICTRGRKDDELKSEEVAICWGFVDPDPESYVIVAGSPHY